MDGEETYPMICHMFVAALPAAVDGLFVRDVVDILEEERVVEEAVEEARFRMTCSRFAVAGACEECVRREVCSGWESELSSPLWTVVVMCCS